MTPGGGANLVCLRDHRRLGRFAYLGLYLHEAANNALRLHILAPDEPNVSRAGLPLGETPPGWVLQTKAGTCMSIGWTELNNLTVYVSSHEFAQTAAVGSSIYAPSLVVDYLPDGNHYYVAWTDLDGYGVQPFTDQAKKHPVPHPLT